MESEQRGHPQMMQVPQNRHQQEQQCKAIVARTVKHSRMEASEQSAHGERSLAVLLLRS